MSQESAEVKEVRFSAQRHEEAIAALLEIPGVVRVSFGLKETSGNVLQQWAYRVYVHAKKPRHELVEAERIPPEVNGISTDVVTGHENDQKELSKKNRDLQPGDQITREVPNEAFQSGSLGLLVQKPPQRFILTCQHVLEDKNLLIDTNTFSVYDPYKRKCNCNNPAATIIPNQGMKGISELGGKRFLVDATLASILDGVKGANVNSDLGRLDQGLRDVSVEIAGPPTPPPSIRLKKCGATTGITEGVVVAFSSTDSTGTTWEMEVKPDPGDTYSETFEIKEDDATIANIIAQFTGKTVQVENKGKNSSGNTNLKLKGHVFSLPGDSGGAVIDSQRRVVGIVRAGFTTEKVTAIVSGRETFVNLITGNGVVEYIFPVFQAMGLSTTTGIIPPGSPSAGAPVEIEAASAADDDAIEELELTLQRSDAGRLFLQLASCHGEEVADLIHHRRRVKVAWYRNKGHAFAAEFLKSLRDPKHEVPNAIAGISLADALHTLRKILWNEGSPGLKEALGQYGDWVIGLILNAPSPLRLSGVMEQLDALC